MSDTEDYEGEATTVTWDRRLCIHIGECGRASNELFVTGRDPWCEPDEVQSNDEVLDVVQRCPTGSLSIRRKDGTLIETAEERNVVVVANHGPLYVRGDLELEGAPDDMPGTRFRIALCRCGQSKRKPYCDNSHIEAGFSDKGAVGRTGSGGGDGPGKLTIKPLKNGALFFKGPFTIVASSGQTRFSGDSTALCRCGQSKNRPFCDGSHKAAGFEAD